MNSFHGIPQEIIKRSTILDLAFSGPRPAEEFCGQCFQSFGDHHYACPAATEARRRKRVKAMNVRHDHITFDVLAIRDTHITLDLEAA